MIELKKKKKLPKRIRNVDICAGSGLFLDIILVLYMALYIMVYILVSRKGYYVYPLAAYTMNSRKPNGY